ncbi:MAG: radical SAM protein [Calditrichaeota bacterium]|nr:radical SAM protein [Candidatus Cloacimonadota bacterium]MCA9785389.1 radical SAM protein [Candidatus Cloacimonadota bacterium]MCB1046272.1 radical SAM protein [Calditrichota bacterium]MCB9474344.1 radical SAM protein [Candidatus Delongbacteria bacterium]
MITFGPIPSRRLGRSLGINNIQSKSCSFSCVYCQAGRTDSLDVERRTYFDPAYVIDQVEARVAQLKEQGEVVNHLSIVPEGEPTLDLNLGLIIKGLKPLGVPIAVISNASLLWMDDVFEELALADWVSLKVDSTRSSVWHAINRPRRSLDLDIILSGMLSFAAQYKGHLVSETMVIKDINDNEEDFLSLASFLGELQPKTAYINLPTRPPAERTIATPSENVVNRSWHILRSAVDHVEYLLGEEGNSFSSTGDLREDLLSITAVHPMRLEAVRELVRKTGSEWVVVEELLAKGYLSTCDYRGEVYYLRKL